MSKKYDEDDNEYYDGEDKKPRLLFIIGVLFVIGLIVFLIFSSCSRDVKSSNNYLASIRVTNGKIEPLFDRNVLNYKVYSSDDTTTIVCSTESNKSKVVGCNEKIEVGEKITTHKITVTAEDNSTKVYTISIEKAVVTDAIKHTATIEGNVENGKATTSKVVLEATSDYENEYYKYQWYKDGTIIENATSNKYVAEKTGNYLVEITNPVSLYTAKSEEYSVVIKAKTEQETTNNNNNNNTDSYTLKIASITGVPTKWTTSAKISVEVNASNGIANKAYSFDGGKTYQSSNSKTFTSNQTVNIKIKDAKGNVISKTITIDKIDSTTPKVTITASNKTSQSVKLSATVDPKTTKSGYTYQWYKDNEKITGATSNVYSATQSGIYKVIVTTGASKTATSNTYTFNKVNNLTCPVLTVTTESGNFIDQKTWTTENVYVKITPDTNTKNYDIYLNKPGNLSSISEVYTYFNTYTYPVKLLINEKGLRVVKIVVKDELGNSKECYSKVYYLK